MALVNHTKRQINAKLVIYGPSWSGKKTSLSYIFRKLKPEHRGVMKSMNIQNDRMMFFDFFPGSKTEMRGYSIHYHLYTISGQDVAPSSWKMLLKGVDGIIFVADSAAGQQAANREGVRQLDEILVASGMSLGATPLVFQFNKRDLEGALSIEEMRNEIPTAAAPITGAVAVTGEGVLEALFTLIRMVQAQLGKEGLDFRKETEQVVNEQELSEEDTITGSGYDTRLPSVGDSADPCLSGTADDNPDNFCPTVEVAGNAVACAGGLRVPLMVRCGNTRKRMTVILSLSIETE